MALSNETVQKILSDNNLSSPNRSQTENHIGEVITFSPGTLTTDDGVEITSVKVLDGDTVVDESTGQSYRIYGVDTNETAKWKSEAEDYANYQKDVTFAILQYAAATGKEITMVRQRDDGYERWVTDIQIDGTSLSGILAENGIAPVSGGAESNPTPNGFISKRDLQDKENRAQSNYNGIWSQEYIRHPLKYKTTDGTSVTRGETDPALGSKVKAMRIANETDPKTNSNALRGQEKIYKEGITKIGDVYLDIPPTQINISQLRNSYSVPQIGGESRPIFNSSARTVVKISNVFSGSSQINNDLKRILCQFIYNPINLVYSEDIYNKVIGDNKYIREAYNADEKQWWVPMTMDEIVLYTLEGHPDCVCANIQMSVFNFAAYFNSDPNVRIEYHKCIDYDSSKEVENNPQINENTYTLHLEEAIHPYNIRVEQKLNQENRRFTPGDSTTTIFKIAGTASSLSVSTKEKEGEELELKKANKKEGLDYLDDSIIRIVNSEVEGLTTGVQVHMKNNWAWMPVIGYSQPVAQYIGPGETSVSLNIKTNQKEMISKLLSTFGDVQNDNGVEIFYDDRYIVSNSLTRLVGSEICSMNNFSASNVNGHPGWSDINITFTKSTYATSETEDEEPNPLAAFDEYWGLQRILAPIGNKVIEEAIYRETNRLRKYMKDISKENNAIGALCSESGFDDVVRYLDPRSIVAYNKCLQVIRNHASTFSVPSDESVSFNVLMTNTIGLSYFKGITGQYEKKNIKLNGLDIFDRMSIARMPKEFANNAQSSEAIAAYAYYTSNSLKVGEEEKNFDGSLEEETLAGYLLRDRLIRVYCNSKSVKGLNGNRTSFVNLNTELWNEMKKIQEGSKDSPYVNLKIYSTRAKTVTFDFPGSKYDKYKTLIINSIKNAMDDAQGTLEVYNKNWSKLALAKSRGYSIDIGFIGTRAEAKLIQLAFSLGSTGEAFKWIRGRAVSFLKENQDEYPNIFVANCYTDSDNDNVMILDPKTKEIHVTEENYDERLKWVFKLTHAPSQALEMFDEDDVKETVQAIKTEDSVADPTARYILPYAAHRYYPKTDYFIKHHQVLSASVGDWFVNEYIGNPDKLFDMIENSVEDAISPLLNKEAWLYPSANQAKLNKNIVRKISEDENDPSKVIEGICLPFFSKDFSDIDKKGALKREKEGAINTAISVISKGIYFDDDGEAIEELPSDIPLDTFATASMCSEGYYDKIKDVGGYVKRYRNNLYNIYSQNINTSGKTAFLYDYANALQGKQVGGYVKLASNVASNSIIGDFDGSFVNSNIDVQRKLGGSYPANCLMFAMQKSPLLFMEQVGRYAEDVSVIGNSLGFNEVEADLKLKAKILRVLIQENAKGIIRNPSTSGESLKYYKKTEKWEHMNGLTTEMKDTLNKLREEIGLPFNINCGYATNGHSPESYHYKGMAVDFYIKETGFADAYKRVVGALSALGIANKVGLGVYPDWNHPGFHLDVRGRHARWGRIGSTYTSLENALAHYDRKQNTGQSSYELESKASSIVTDLKARLSPYKYAYYVNDQDIREYINRTNYVMRDRESLSWLQSRIAKRTQAYYPARLRNVDNQTKEMAARNSLISMPVTVGVENAFPTYKMYIIEEDTSDIRYFSLDDYYDVRTLQDVMVVR
jgi:endonuclease YncB( thermonuclease family)